MSDVEKVQWRELRKCSLCPLPMRKLRRAAQKIGSSITIAPPAHDHENTLTFRGHFQNASWRTRRNGNGEGLRYQSLSDLSHYFWKMCVPLEYNKKCLHYCI